MYMTDEARCDCSCHDDDDVEHIMPCCAQCLYCDRNIKEIYLNSHVEECKVENTRVKCMNCEVVVESAMYEGHLEKCGREPEEIARRIKVEEEDR